jgi:hypothetical protein
LHHLQGRRGEMMEGAGSSETLVTAPNCMMSPSKWLHSQFKQTDFCIKHFPCEEHNFLFVFRRYCKDHTKQVLWAGSSLDLYLGCFQFESRPGHQLSWLRFPWISLFYPG